MIANILEKLLFKNQSVSEDERQELLDWFGRVENAAAKANPLTGKITPGGEQSDITAMVQEALKSRQWINNLAEIADKIGLQIAGEFRTGNGKTPGDGFTGGRFGYPGFTYGGTEYFLVGVENDILQVGLSLADGKIIFGGGDGWLDNYGLFFKNQEGFLGFVTTGGVIDDVGMYIDSNDNLVLTNKVGARGVRFDLDDASHNVHQLSFNSDDNGSIDIPAGATYNIDGTPHTHTLTGSVTPETNANDIFRVNGSSTSAFVGTIATLPGGAVLTYNITSGNENAMVPVSTSQLAKMRLYNSTRGNSALISDCVIGTNTITLAGNVPVSWQVGDTIDISSQTVSGGTGNWVDLEVVSGPTGKAAIFASIQVTDSGAGNITARIHPLETFGAGKIQATVAQVAGVPVANFALVKMTNNVFSASWIASGAGTMTFVIREVGYTV